ncbi:hypothetical protein IAR55_005329 [Kwoniella newhampshirensis]|uniref:BIR-domain-containing protein n=1 Tax=Kwoniella newhampshirensis TaxID=1651941 RepID=A0AAW0YVP4_9TREE
MQYQDTRFESFSAITRPKSKAKPAFPLTTATHPYLTPKSLSEAGFYHTPGSSSSNHDICKCFLCDLELGGWDVNDDPFEEHAQRGKCGWADMVCAVKVEKRKRDRSGGKYETIYETPESLPQSDHSIDQRLATYNKWWPHKQKRGWLPTAKALARAGFVYNPSTESKDAVICPYCEYSVEGWEATDDPWKIHQTKIPDCHYFRAKQHGDSGEVVTEEVKSKPVAKGKKSEAPKRSKRGTTAAQVVLSDSEPEPEPIQSQTIPSEPDDEQTAATSQTTTTSKRAAKPRATTSTRAKTGGRGKKKAATAEPEVEGVDEPEVEEEIEETEQVVEEELAESQVEEVKAKKTRAKAKATRKPRATTSSKSKSKKKVEAEEEEEEEEEEIEVAEEVQSEAGPTQNNHVASEAPSPPSSKPASQSKSTKSSKTSKPASKPSSKGSSSKPLPPLPPTSAPPSPSPSPAKRPLSQLDRFANIPASSPIPSPRSKSTLRSTHSSKPSPHRALPREEFDSSVQRGAVEARKVIADLMSSPFVGPPSRSAMSKEEEDEGPEGALVLTDEQKKMTLEELVRAEMKKRYLELEKEGQAMISQWEERAKYQRKKIEVV